jgi:hypothetical protein
MDLRIFHDRIYGRHSNQLFVFEPAWDTFRPIDHVAWDGTRYTILDETFKRDLFDPNYGYGTLEMKALCRQLINETELDTATELKDIVEFWKWYGETKLKWWKDRPCLFASPCVSREQDGWKSYLHYMNVRAKTLRQPVRGRLTKRLGIKQVLPPK